MDVMGCCVHVLSDVVGDQPAIPVAPAPDAFGGPSPSDFPGFDMEAGSVEFRSWPTNFKPDSCVHKCDYSDWLHLCVKNFFILSLLGSGA